MVYTTELFSQNLHIISKNITKSKDGYMIALYIQDIPAISTLTQDFIDTYSSLYKIKKMHIYKALHHSYNKSFVFQYFKLSR